jgi:hypothetical protein
MRVSAAPDAGPDTWRIEPQDETWLPLVTRRCFARNPLSLAAVLKPHPQDSGVLLRGGLEELLQGLGEARREVEALRAAGLAALACRTYAAACLVRRALLTRPVCLACTEVTFTPHVEDSELEPVAAHRLGQLVFRAEAGAPAAEERGLLLVPAGQRALARHLRLPAGVALLPGQEHTDLGLRASAAPTASPGGTHLLATIELRRGSVFRCEHAKYCAVAGLSYYPEVRVKLPFPKGSSEQLRRQGFAISSGGVLSSTSSLPVREEFLRQLLPAATFEPPRVIHLDFAPLGFATREEVLRSAFDELLLEMEEVAAQLLALARAGEAAQTTR